MFAVPGWSVSASKLKTQTQPVKSKDGDHEDSRGDGESDQKKPYPNWNKSKKRKRGAGAQDDPIDDQKFAELYETVIEKKQQPGKKENSKRSRQKSHEEVEQPQDVTKPVNGQSKKKNHKSEKRQKKDGRDQGVQSQQPPKLAKEKEQQRNGTTAKPKSDVAKTRPLEQNQVPQRKPTKPPPMPPTAPATSLTPLQAKMRQKLVSARFRYINETLYTSPSSSAQELFGSNPEMFNEYHEGFRKQVEVWPENPVDGYVTELKQRASHSHDHRKQRQKHGKGSTSSSSGAAPLPRNKGTCTIADLGCGDARLASSLQSASKKLHLKILSYDLSSSPDNDLITAADIANLPLQDGSINVGLFCLALMGTNWLDFIDEAFRSLHWKGELWIAEIKSRFGRVEPPKKKQQQNISGKKQQKAEDDHPGHDENLLAEIDGEAVQKGSETTDVSKFVNVLRKHGFVLQGEPDLSNKMFVKLRFLKAAKPISGKHAASGTTRVSGGDQDGAGDEKVLKPCVYKLR